MRKIIFLFSLLVFVLTIQAQVPESVKAKIENYPNKFSDFNDLAKQINLDFKSKKEKASAIYTWIALNISYDSESLKYPSNPTTIKYSSMEEKRTKLKKHQQDIASKTLSENKGVCIGYASLYKELADLCAIECEIVSGFSKTKLSQIGHMSQNSDHAWNVIKLNGKWQLVDVTWGAGASSLETGDFMKGYTDVYFMCSPEKFFLKHFPSDEKWLLIKKKKTDFVNLPLYYTGYLSSGFRFVLPKTGIVELKNSKKMVFKLKMDSKSSQMDLSYAFYGDKYGKPITVSKKRQNAQFSIPISRNKKGYLLIYNNGWAIAAFKLI